MVVRNRNELILGVFVIVCAIVMFVLGVKHEGPNHTEIDIDPNSHYLETRYSRTTGKEFGTKIREGKDIIHTDRIVALIMAAFGIYLVHSNWKRIH